MNLALGIDPGVTGALAFYDPYRDALEVFDMPTHTVKVNKKDKRRLDLHQLARIVRERRNFVGCAVVEEVSAMPGQGVTSMFGFGFSAGAAQMALAANEIKYLPVAPITWKRAMKVTNDKDATRQRASQLMPKHAINWPLKKHDGRAEASIIAYYAALTMPLKRAERVEDIL